MKTKKKTDEHQPHDMIIVGGGIAGLYCAYKILQQNPQCNILLLEKSDSFCERWKMARFAGMKLAMGAGIIRKEKDQRMMQLVHELGIHDEIAKTEFTVQTKHVFNNQPLLHFSANQILQYLRAAWRRLPASEKYRITFKNLGLRTLKLRLYRQFLLQVGYTDFEQSPAHIVLQYYGLDDFIRSGWQAFGLDWDIIRNHLVKHLNNRPNLRLLKNANVIATTKIEEEEEKDEEKENHPQQYSVQYRRADDNQIYTHTTHKLIFACRMDNYVEGILPKMVSSYYKMLKECFRGNPYLRCYVQFNRESTRIMDDLINGFTCVNSPLQKIIPVNKKKGVYMISYSDNQSAITMATEIVVNKSSLQATIEKTFGLDSGVIGIQRYISQFWPVGTHWVADIPEEFGHNYRAFLKYVQNPYPGLFMVGEMVSTNQGWAEGALESVESVLPSLVSINL